MPVRRTDDSTRPVAQLRQAPQVPLQLPRSQPVPPQPAGPQPAGSQVDRPADRGHEVGHVVIHLRGDVDLDAALRAAGHISAALEAGPASVDVNLESVTFVDSCLLNVLAVWRQRCHAAGSLLLVTCSNEPTRGLFALAGMDDVLQPSRAVTPL